MKTAPKGYLWLGVFFILSFVVSAQNSNPLGSLLKEDSESVTLLASYPDSIRTAALVAAQNPEALLHMQELQEQTKRSFRDITSGLEREEQENIWNISRYPGLVEKLTDGGRKSKSELEQIAAGYPQDVREAITGSGRKNYSELKQVAGLNRSTDDALNTIVSRYPREVQQSYRTVLRHPELVDLMTSNMRMTVKAGDLHKTSPVRLRQQMDSLSAETAAKQAREAKDWKEGLDKNPQAKEEYEKAANEYAKTQGGVTGGGNANVTQEVVVVNYVHPYSYWYGSPWWWDPFWYPYPYYGWHMGFYYYYPPYSMVYFGYPSPYFMSWYMFYYPNHYYYPYFTDYCIDHYYGHRNTPSQTNHEIGKWVNAERPRVSEDFFRDDKNRPERIRELGKAEMETAEHNVRNPGQQLTREDYVTSNAQSFPQLAPQVRHNAPAKPNPATALPDRTGSGGPVTAPPMPDRPTTPAPGGQTSPAPGGTVPNRTYPMPQPTPQQRPDIFTPRPQPQPQHVPSPRPRITPNLPRPMPSPSPRPRR